MQGKRKVLETSVDIGDFTLENYKSNVVFRDRVNKVLYNVIYDHSIKSVKEDECYGANVVDKLLHPFYNPYTIVVTALSKLGLSGDAVPEDLKEFLVDKVAGYRDYVVSSVNKLVSNLVTLRGFDQRPSFVVGLVENTSKTKLHEYVSRDVVVDGYVVDYFASGSSGDDQSVCVYPEPERGRWRDLVCFKRVEAAEDYLFAKTGKVVDLNKLLFEGKVVKKRSRVTSRNVSVISRPKYLDGLKRLQEADAPSYIVKAYKSGDVDFVESYMKTDEVLPADQQFIVDEALHTAEEACNDFEEVVKEILNTDTQFEVVGLAFGDGEPVESLTTSENSDVEVLDVVPFFESLAYGPVVVLPIPEGLAESDLQDDPALVLLKESFPVVSSGDNGAFYLSLEESLEVPEHDGIVDGVLEQVADVFYESTQADDSDGVTVLFGNVPAIVVSLDESVEIVDEGSLEDLPDYVVEALSVKDYRVFEIYIDRAMKKLGDKFASMLKKKYNK